MKIAIAIAMTIAATAPALADCKSEVDDAFAKLRAAKSFRQELKISDELRGTLSMKVEYILPDRMHQSVSMGDAALTMETIVAEGKVYSNNGQGWAEVPEKFANAILAQMKAVAEPPKSDISYACLGDKELDGKAYLAYTAKLPAPEEPRKAAGAAEKPANIQVLYVDKTSGIPARNIVARQDAPDKRLFDGTYIPVQDISIKAPEIKQGEAKAPEAAK